MIEEKIKYIESITLKKLWGEVDIDWHLDPKINILVGKNGTGKSTIINVIESIICEQDIDLQFYTQFAKINFHSQRYISLERIELSEKDIQGNLKIKNPYRDLTTLAFIQIMSVVKQKSETEEENYYTYVKTIKPYKNSFLSYKIKFKSIVNESNKNKIVNIFDDILSLVKISTFEMLIKDFERQEEKKENIKTELDFVLSKLIDKFKSYQLTLKKSIENELKEKDEIIKILSSQETASNEDLERLRQLIKEKEEINKKINYHKDLFLNLINELFAETEKTIDFDADNSIIFRKPNDKIITAYQLSSGEKQILIILLQVLMQNNQPSIILMDEPELSLHLSWQLRLIDMIQSLNENCQLIIATHAPGIFSKGWKDKVTDIRDIIKN